MPVIPDIEFPAIAPRGHRPRFGMAVRVPLSSCMVDPATMADISRYMKLTGCSKGVLIDHLVMFAKDPLFLEWMLWRTKKAAPASTLHAAKANQALTPHDAVNPSPVNRKASRPTTSPHGH